MPIDLDKHRRDRAAARAAAAGREIAEPETIVLDGKVIATLPQELPLVVLQPLLNVSTDILLVVRQAVALQCGDDENAADVVQLALDIFASNAELPQQVLDAVTDVARRLLGPDGYAALLEFNPSREDITALARGVLAHYGVTLGESSRSASSPGTGGPTSNATSPSSTPGSETTHEASGQLLELPGSSESAAS
jgi:hypothetical protein